MTFKKSVFNEFWRGYLLGLAFTGNDESLVDGEYKTDSIYHNPGGCISEVVDLDELENQMVSDGIDLDELKADCLGFLTQSIELIGDDEYERAGSDFHLTRNGHGAGFWDGDWENGDELTELSEPFGSCELCRCDGKLYITN
tara:strand:+ start:679 stop:1104 length:426 start_codon:yes stop_codon:yes gene_type:complete